MKILVTGGAGLIGKHAVDRLLRSGHDVVTLVREPIEERKDGLARAPREVVGNASDVGLLAELCAGVDAVLHLAAIPAPGGYTARELVENNVVSTVTVFEAAGLSGVKAVVFASSISILGMAWSDALMTPVYLPIDEAHPLRPTEGYALSKECDEATARMASRRWGMPIVGLRFPYTDVHDTIVARAADPQQEFALARELWAYLDMRDAARACELALEEAVAGRVPGCTVLNVIADDVILDAPLGELVDQWHPELSGDMAGYPQRGAYAVRQAREVLGFSAEYLLRATI